MDEHFLNLDADTLGIEAHFETAAANLLAEIAEVRRVAAWTREKFGTAPDISYLDAREAAIIRERDELRDLFAARADAKDFE